MMQSEQGPIGATRVMAPRDDISVSVNGQGGWRKATPASHKAEELAQAGTAAQSDRTRAIVAFKRVAVHLGLKSADVLLLDTLAAFTRPQDWDAGQRPIVWPSNAYLMERTGFSLSTLKRHGRRLVEAGVVTHRDSPNGKRWGHRDASGRIVEAYGFDLSPLAARMAEFEALDAAMQAERAECQKIRRQITILRRSIRAKLEAGQGVSLYLQTRFARLLRHLPGPRSGRILLLRVHRLFKLLATRIHKEQQNCTYSTPMGAKNDPHLQDTTEDQTVTQGSRAENGTKQDCLTLSDNEDLVLPVVLNACPEFSQWVSNMDRTIRHWHGFVSVADEIRPMLGISARIWHYALSRMGPRNTAAALA